MGCSSSQNENERIILLKKIKAKIMQIIKRNPFYSLSVKDFNEFMENEVDKKENITKSITYTFFKEDDDININIFNNVVSFAYKRFSSRCLFSNDEDIKISLLYFIYFFLAEKQKGSNKFMYKKIYKLFEKIKIKESDDKIYFHSGKFSFLILNLIQLCTYIFIYFFCAPSLLEDNFKKYEIKTIFSNEKKTEKYHPDAIDKYIEEYLYSINNNLRPKIVNCIILTDVLQPISDYITDNKNIDICCIDLSKLKEIIDILIEKMNHKYYFDLFFNTDNILV